MIGKNCRVKLAAWHELQPQHLALGIYKYHSARRSAAESVVRYFALSSGRSGREMTVRSVARSSWLEAR